MRQMLKKEKSISFGKNDPDILQSQTPCKKLFSSNTQMDDVGQEKLGSFQLSSSKLCKHIKEE